MQHRQHHGPNSSLHCDRESGILGASSAQDNNNSDADDDNSGGLSNKMDSKHLSESETIDQGEWETELPPTLDAPLLPPINDPVVPAVIDAPTLLPTTKVAHELAAINEANCRIAAEPTMMTNNTVAADPITMTNIVTWNQVSNSSVSSSVTHKNCPCSANTHH